MDNQELFQELMERSANHDLIAEVALCNGDVEISQYEEKVAHLYACFASILICFERFEKPEFEKEV